MEACQVPACLTKSQPCSNRVYVKRLEYLTVAAIVDKRSWDSWNKLWKAINLSAFQALTPPFSLKQFPPVPKTLGVIILVQFFHCRIYFLPKTSIVYREEGNDCFVQIRKVQTDPRLVSIIVSFSHRLHVSFAVNTSDFLKVPRLSRFFHARFYRFISRPYFSRFSS